MEAKPTNGLPDRIKLVPIKGSYREFARRQARSLGLDEDSHSGKPPSTLLADLLSLNPRNPGEDSTDQVQC